MLTVTLLPVSVAQAQTVTADFAYRSGATPIVPSGILGVGGIGSSLSEQGAINRLATAGINETRFWIDLSQIYHEDQKPYFHALDRTLGKLQSSGVHPIAVIFRTPSPYGYDWCKPPSDFEQWGQLAAEVVAHVDQKFPGVLQDYEIWNEPDFATSLCVIDDTARLNAYLSMFAAAASAMHAQANADGEPIRTGGPVLAQIGLAPIWISALVNNEATAPYVDFVSFHHYMTGQNEIDTGMTWPELYSLTQSTRQGLIACYKYIEQFVRAGHQPNAATTPIYISEFNSSWAFAVDCCRNNTTYGSLWNTVAITDLLNVVYSGASAVPSRLVYFSVSGKYFCIMGEWNSKMDCNPSVMDPYPQFYAYQLFASSDYLDLQAGGHMAASVSPASTKSGLGATAFYTSTADTVVVVNPTATTYSALKVEVINPGFTSAKGEVFLLDSSHGKISREPVALQSVSGGYSAEVEIPPYATVALSVKGGAAGSPPKPVLTVAPRNGNHPLTVDIDSSASERGGSYIIGRTIDFGDGRWLNWTQRTSHTYNKAGNYTLRLLLRDQDGQLAITSTTITVH
jgi:hypothetical protein